MLGVPLGPIGATTGVMVGALMGAKVGDLPRAKVGDLPRSKVGKLVVAKVGGGPVVGSVGRYVYKPLGVFEQMEFGPQRLVAVLHSTDRGERMHVLEQIKVVKLALAITHHQYLYKD